MCRAASSAGVPATATAMRDPGGQRRVGRRKGVKRKQGVDKSSRTSWRRSPESVMMTNSCSIIGPFAHFRRTCTYVVKCSLHSCLQVTTTRQADVAEFLIKDSA